MDSTRLRLERVVVFLLLAGVMALPVASLAQEATGATGGDESAAQPHGAVLSCPHGMVLVPSTSSVLAPSGGPLKAFCIDVFEFPNVPGSLPRYDISWIEATQVEYYQDNQKHKFFDH